MIKEGVIMIALAGVSCGGMDATAPLPGTECNECRSFYVCPSNNPVETAVCNAGKVTKLTACLQRHDCGETEISFWECASACAITRVACHGAVVVNCGEDDDCVSDGHRQCKDRYNGKEEGSLACWQNCKDTTGWPPIQE